MLGIDQGTTQTTAVVVDQTGKVVAKHSVVLKASFPKPGWVEQDPVELVETVTQACKPLLEAHGRSIEAVGFDNQGESFVLWDAESGKALTQVIVWQDARGECVCGELKAHESVMREKTGLFLQSYFSAPKLKQILDERPAIREAAENGKVKFGECRCGYMDNVRSDAGIPIRDDRDVDAILLVEREASYYGSLHCGKDAFVQHSYPQMGC